MDKVKDFKARETLITGAGSGIGRATALAFAQAGARLWVVDIRLEAARDTAALIQAQGGVARALQCDVADMDAMQAMAAQVHDEIEALDILMNNAGIGSGGRFLDTTLEAWRKVMDINLMGVVHGCHAFLPAMVARGKGGHVINIASAAAFVAAPEMPIYAASKFAVQGFTESLRGDMAAHGIGVSAICPGIINTGIVASSLMQGALGEQGRQGRVEAFYKKRNYTPEQVAAAILRAVRRNVAVQPVSPEAWGMYYAKRLAPRLLDKLAAVQLPFLK